MPCAGQGRKDAGNVQILQAPNHLVLPPNAVDSSRCQNERPSDSMRTSPIRNVADRIGDLAIEKPQGACPVSYSDIDSEDEIILFSGRTRENLMKPGVIKEPAARKGNGVHYGRRNLRRNCNHLSRRRSLQAEQNVIMADYISNMQSVGGISETEMTQMNQHRDLDLGMCTEPEGEVSTEGPATDKNFDGKTYDDKDWDSVSLQDFETLSSSNEQMDATPEILRKRLRNSQVQYLVVAPDESVDEARWLDRHHLTAPDALDVIGVFEKEQTRLKPLTDESSESEHDARPENVTDRGHQTLKSQSGVSDDDIARLLSKQPEIGLFENNIVLFDDDGSDGELNSKITAIASSAASQHPLCRVGKPKKGSGIDIPSTAAYVESSSPYSYDGFDIMDHDRPSLRTKVKASHPSKKILDISDVDMERSMIATWQSDRTKKKQRKQARDLLRRQGLLGKKEKSESRRVASQDNAWEGIGSEIKNFLRSPADSQRLAPMGQKERKLIHGAAHMAGLKSKSYGAGASRFPILHRTSRTRTLTPALEAQIDAMFVSRNPHARLDKHKRKDFPAGQSGRGRTATAASYRDGEVVGVGAPELGMENKGRAMLEKMGWSTGKSLGPLSNKGIAQPIEQIVKTSKAGLG